MNAEKPDIVVVDDNLDNLRILSDMLRNHGYIPRPAASGALALDAVKASPPVLILLDIMMPETDGFEVCRRLKSGNDTRDIPVIFITALDQLENKVKAFAAGGVDYITKPFQEAEVMARIDTHVGLVRAKEHLRETEARMQKLQK
ncbi:MAG: response regulator, partial [Desulfosalsimonas sp.]